MGKTDTVTVDLRMDQVRGVRCTRGTITTVDHWCWGPGCTHGDVGAGRGSLPTGAMGVPGGCIRGDMFSTTCTPLDTWVGCGIGILCDVPLGYVRGVMLHRWVRPEGGSDGVAAQSESGVGGTTRVTSIIGGRH